MSVWGSCNARLFDEICTSIMILDAPREARTLRLYFWNTGGYPSLKEDLFLLKKIPDGLTLYEVLLSYRLPIFTVMLPGPSFVENYFVYESQCVNVLNLNELSVFLVLMVMLMSTQFSLAYTCACAYALVKTRLKKKRTRNLAN